MADVLRVLSKKGAREVLGQLNGSPKRFSQLAAAIKSKRTLANRLRELEEAGLISREITDDRPPSAIYQLTTKGKKILNLATKFEEIS
jgi:DNA-binding HxlR family transcriptional regulator